MNILVTGHMGYLGHAIVEVLLADGHEVTGLDVNLYETCTLTALAPSRAAQDREHALKVDLRDVEPEHLKGIDHCIHLAGLSNDPLGDLDPELTFAINHLASVKLACLCRDAGVKRFVAASSCSIYGASDERELSENSIVAPVTPYAKSKLLMEQDILGLASESFSPVFLRGGTVYGPAPRIRFDLVVNNLVAWAISTGQVLLNSDGSAWRPFVHVQDFANVFCAMLSTPLDKVRCQSFDVVPQGENFQIKIIAEKIAFRIPNAKLVFKPGSNSDIRNYRVSGAKLAGVLGTDWHTMTLDQGIDELANILSMTMITPGEFEGAKYQRLAHLKSRIADGELSADLRLTSGGV